ncbi:MAG: NifB/NifX family molybdenum-iron cluster-binding protein [Syntrophotaleaceae bacterium]
MPHVNDQISVTIAIPHYGQRIMPRFGLARQFCLATANLQQRRLLQLLHREWDPEQEPSLALWLKSMEVSGVICDGIHSRFQAALRAEGLWIIGGAWGDIAEVLERWVLGELTASDSLSGPGRASCCRPSRSPRCPTPTERNKPS